MRWLLLFVPVAILLEVLAPERHVLVFLAAALAILPAAGMLGHATEKLAERTGEGVGGLLNATFGNAAELILALAALRSGLPDIVKASLAGSIVGNILLVLGASMLAGGVRHHHQEYNAAAAKSQATMLVLATIALIVPAAYRAASGDAASTSKTELSLWIAIVLLLVYASNLFFSLVTHREVFTGSG
jgi:Ca2+:H+ antiporter